MNQQTKTPLHLRLLAACLFVLLAVIPSTAQLPQFHIQSFNLNQLDQSAKTGPQAKRDGNGRLYAIVKVRSDNNDDLRLYRFSFGMINSLDVERTYDGERWLYVADDAKKISIERDGYRSISGHQLPVTIKAGNVYEMVLSAEATIIYTQIIQFHVTPANANATVMLNGEKLGDTDHEGNVVGTRPLGNYEYQVFAENYHTSSGRISLDRANETHVENVQLRPNFGNVTLTVDADADILVNGQLRGRRTWTGMLRAGTYSVECRGDERYTPSRQTITIEENGNHTIPLTPPAPITGTLQVLTSPVGATVFIDGQQQSRTTPMSVTNLIIGQHQVELRRDNYKTEQLTVEIRRGETTPIDITLSDMAHMTIRSHPSGATLFIDGNRVGQTPYQADMASGDYTLRLTCKGWHDYERRHHLSSSHPEVTLRMSRQYQLPSAFYLNGGLQVGSLMGAGIAAGAFISNVNIEAGYTLGLAKSEDIYWNYTGDGDKRPVVCQYKPSAISLKAGYGIIIGTSFRLTPQVGATIVQLSATDSKTHVVSAAIGARADYALASNVGLFAAPEVDFALQKGDIYQQLEPLSSKIKGWGTGFNLRVGLCLFF